MNVPVPPRPQPKIVSARHARMMLIVFGVRHLVGVILFAILTMMFYNLGGPGWVGVGAGGAVYAVVAALNLRKLYRQYQRRRAAEAQSVSA
jgi:hypothetical protein